MSIVRDWFEGTWTVLGFTVIVVPVDERVGTGTRKMIADKINKVNRSGNFEFISVSSHCII